MIPYSIHMGISIESRELVPTPCFIDTYTPENITGLRRYDPHLLDALALLRQGIWEQREKNGITATDTEIFEYQLSGETNASIAFWGWQKTKNYHSFLLVAWNIRDNIVGVAEGRRYRHSGIDEDAIFVNWVVVRDCGSNDQDDYSYRGKGIASRLYRKVKQIAKDHDIKLLIAGINILNSRSIRFHEKEGFSNEKFAGEYSTDGLPMPHPTENGAFIPAWHLDEGGIIEFYTKRLK